MQEYERLISENMLRQVQFVPSRYNKFPRFAILQGPHTIEDADERYDKLKQFVLVNKHIIQKLDRYGSDDCFNDFFARGLKEL